MFLETLRSQKYIAYMAIVDMEMEVGKTMRRRQVEGGRGILSLEGRRREDADMLKMAMGRGAQLYVGCSMTRRIQNWDVGNSISIDLWAD